MHRDSKRCPRCVAVLPIAAFGSDRSKPDGRCSACRPCITAERHAARARNRAFIDEVNGRTVCAQCGAQPVEWHNPEHVELNRQTFRIGFMVSSGRPISAIEEEIARCTPLCRLCHMKEDGRLAAFKRNRGNRPRNSSPCSVCGRQYHPLRRGLCHRCHERQRRAAKLSDNIAG
jgi:hypothetical protein